MNLRSKWLTIIFGSIPTTLMAHSFGTPYVLPVPFWIYVYGCGATLILTFALLCYFLSAPHISRANNAFRTTTFHLKCWTVRLLRAGALFCLLLTIVAGLVGTSDPNSNIAMTLFWVFFLLSFAYVSVLLGDIYALINPWALLLAGLQRMGMHRPTALTYPRWLSYWPAFLFYIGLVWIELFAEPTPRLLAIILVVYTVVTLIGSYLFGKETWIKQADFFSVYFRMIGKLAPIRYQYASNRWCVDFRWPLRGTLESHPRNTSLVMFVLFILASTTYDSIHDTTFWIGLFWRNALVLLQPIWGTNLNKAQALLDNWYDLYRWTGLLIFPCFYLCLYLAMLMLAKLWIKRGPPLSQLMLLFCYPLLPIAIAYNATHYFTFIISQMRSFPWLLADPLGLGWNLLALPQNPGPTVLPMGFIWHTQVAILLLGHVASVYLAHEVAAKTFPTQRQIILSQVPLLVLMVGYTTLGLWILSLPLGADGS